MKWDEFSRWRPDARLRAQAKAKTRNLPGYKDAVRALREAEAFAAKIPDLLDRVQAACKHPVERQTLEEYYSQDEFGDYSDTCRKRLVCEVCGRLVDEWYT